MITYLRSMYCRTFKSDRPIFFIIIISVIFCIVKFFGNILAPILTSILIAYLLESVINFSSKIFNVNRIFMLYFVFILFLTFIIFVLAILLPKVIYQLIEFIHNINWHVKNLENNLYYLSDKYPRVINNKCFLYLLNIIENINFDKLASISQYLIKFSLNSLSKLFTFLIYFFIVPILAFFFIKDKEKISFWLSKIFPKFINVLKDFWIEIRPRLDNYLKGKIIEFLILVIFTYLGFIYFNLNYSLLLAILVGISVLIPYIGMVIVTFPISIIGISQYGLSYNLLYMFVFYLSIQFLDGNCLVPILYSEALNLRPMTVIFSILIFGRLWGLWGLVFAMPLVILINTFIEVLIKYRISIN